MITIRRIIAAVSVAAVLASGAGPAWAGEFNVSKQGSVIEVPSHAQPVATSVQSVPPTIVHVTASGGFNWGDAAIGAAGGVAILVLGAGLVLGSRASGGHGRFRQA